MNKQILALAVLLAAASAVLAQTPSPDATPAPPITQPELPQQGRSAEGVPSRRLVPRETAQPQTEQAHIRAEEAQARSGGKVTGKERVRLRRDRHRAGRAIHRRKHERKDRS
jgi:hypothetical protein